MCLIIISMSTLAFCSSNYSSLDHVLFFLTSIFVTIGISLFIDSFGAWKRLEDLLIKTLSFLEKGWGLGWLMSLWVVLMLETNLPPFDFSIWGRITVDLSCKVFLDIIFVVLWDMVSLCKYLWFLASREVGSRESFFLMLLWFSVFVRSSSLSSSPYVLTEFLYLEDLIFIPSFTAFIIREEFMWFYVYKPYSTLAVWFILPMLIC